MKTLFLILLFAIPALSQPDISAYTKVGQNGVIGFYATKGEGKPSTMKFKGLMSFIVSTDADEDALDPYNYLITDFTADCTRGTALQGDTSGMVEGKPVTRKGTQKTFQKPEPKSPIDAALKFVCTQKFGLET